MKKIRFTEEGIADRYNEGKMRCPTHLSIGQEGVAAAVGQALTSGDFAVSTHRSHGHYLGKGGDLKRMLAEIYGKATGCSRGLGGSMHLIDKSVGFMGSTAIVGGTIPIGVGLGLAIKLEKIEKVSCVFLGDGAAEEGGFFEALNFAVLKKLPVLFVCENNFYSVYSHLRVRQPEGRRIYKMVEAMGCPSLLGDGNKAWETYKNTQKAVEGIRAGAGPFFVEFENYRWREHCGPNFDNDIGYRSEEEFLQWKARDPILDLESTLLKEGGMLQSDMEEMDSALKEEVKEAFAFAENSPFPQEESMFTRIYASECHETAELC